MASKPYTCFVARSTFNGYTMGGDGRDVLYQAAVALTALVLVETAPGQLLVFP